MCVFCKIIKGEIPSKKIYEDDDVLAILDISQATLGHTLVLPKKHYENLFSIENNDYLKVMEKVKMLAKAITSALNASGCIILNNAVIQNGSKIGNATIINPGVEIHHDSSVGNFCCIYTNSVIRTYSNIKDCVKIGSNVTVKNEILRKHNELLRKEKGEVQ